MRKVFLFLAALAVYAEAQFALCIPMAVATTPVFSWNSGATIECNFPPDSSYSTVVSLTLPELVVAENLRIEGPNLPVMVEVYLPLLTTVTGWYLTFNDLPSVTYIDLPALVSSNFPLWVYNLASFDGGLNIPVLHDAGGIWFHEWGASLPPCHLQQDIYLPSLVSQHRFSAEFGDIDGYGVYMMLPRSHTVIYGPLLTDPPVSYSFPNGIYHNLELDCPAPKVWNGVDWIDGPPYSEAGYHSCETNKAAMDWCSRGYCSCEQRDVGRTHCLCPTTPHWINNHMWVSEWLADRNLTLPPV